MHRPSQNALRGRRMPIAPVWNPEGGLLTKPKIWSIWCKLRGHKFLLLADDLVAEHALDHFTVVMVCLHCGYPDEECINCDWELWEDLI